MFPKNEFLFYISKQKTIEIGMYLGDVSTGCRYRGLVHITDVKTKENILINEDDIFKTFNEAVEFLED